MPKAKAKTKKPAYYILDGSSDDMMLLYPPPNPSFMDHWVGGRRFSVQPQEPVVATIQPGYEESELLPYFNAARLMSDAFYKALQGAGVDNLDVYDAVIESEDGSVKHSGYKAFNIVGVVKAADLKKTVFDGDSRLVDASIQTLEIDPDKAGGLLMFRLAEFVSAVVVHEQVKRAIEKKEFANVIFREPTDFIS